LGGSAWAYDRPRLDPLTHKTAVANYRAVIDAIARRDKARILVDGMTSANDLGLSDAVSGPGGCSYRCALARTQTRQSCDQLSAHFTQQTLPGAGGQACD
jgi:hypothetical protein